MKGIRRGYLVRVRKGSNITGVIAGQGRVYAVKRGSAEVIFDPKTVKFDRDGVWVGHSGTGHPNETSHWFCEAGTLERVEEAAAPKKAVKKKAVAR